MGIQILGIGGQQVATIRFSCGGQPALVDSETKAHLSIAASQFEIDQVFSPVIALSYSFESLFHIVPSLIAKHIQPFLDIGQFIQKAL